jgi:hypothetical protein
MSVGVAAAWEPPGSSPVNRKTPPRRVWMFPFALLGVAVVPLWFRAEAPRILGGVNDFLGIYAGSRLAGSAEQFNADAYLREQVRVTGWSAPSILYTRLPAFAVLLRPLGRLAYLHAYVLWQILSLASFAAFLFVWPAPDRALLACAACWSLPLFAGLAGGQDVAFLLLIMAIAWRLAPSRPFTAGVMLGLLTLKFHLFLLVPVFLIAQRRWRMLAGAGTAAGGILAVCFAVAGPNWIPEYARFVLQGQTNPDVRAMPNLHGLLDGLPHSLAWEAVGAVLIAVAVAWVAQRTSFSAGFSTALLGSLLISHHAYAADVLLLLPALLTLATEVPRIPLRWLAILLLSPLPFLVKPVVPLAGPVPLLLAALLVALTASVAAFPRPERPRLALAASR